MRTIKLFATLRDFVGAKDITVPFDGGGTARDLIQAIRQVNPALGDKIADQDGQLSGLVHIFVEGRNIDWLQGLDTVIADTDDVFLIPPVAGG
jgi:MoaD family protein